MAAQHKDIRIPFVIKDKRGKEHHYEAVGFLEEGETRVEGCVMFARTNEDGQAANEKDEKLLSEHSDQLPKSLRHHSLATAGHHPRFYEYTFHFEWGDDNKWHRYCQHYNYLRYARFFMVRRVPRHKTVVK